MARSGRLIGKNRGLLWLFLIAFSGVLAAAYYYRPDGRIGVVHPVRGVAVQAVYATGTVEPVTMLPLASRVTARLTALLADENQQVEKGQVLAQMEDENLQKTLAELQAKAILAEKEYERREALVTDGTVSKEAIDQALAQRDAARAAVERAQAEINFLKLTAPDAGTIIRRDGEIGELIPAGQPVFWLSCCEGLRIEAEVDEEDISLVKVGQKAVIRADAFPGKIFHGEVSSITPKGDPVSRSYRVRVALQPDTALMIGMTAETNIIIREESNALLVPESAVADDGKIMVFRDGKFTAIDIAVGTKTPAVIEIREGLMESDLIAADAAAANDAGNGAKIKIEKWKAP